MTDRHCHRTVRELLPVDAPPGASSASRRPYRPPRLIEYGSLLDLTLGPSAGTGESGNPEIFRA